MQICDNFFSNQTVLCITISQKVSFAKIKKEIRYTDDSCGHTNSEQVKILNHVQRKLPKGDKIS